MMLRLTTLTRATIVALGAVALFACAPTGVGDPCEPEVQPEGGFQPGETVVETASLQCRTRVCMFYNSNSFCTQRCETDDDCNAEWFEEGPSQGDVEQAYCEAEVTVGSPQCSAATACPRAPPPARSNPIVRSGRRNRLGRRAEALVVRHLEANGLEVLDRNVRTKLGEIDIVARDGDVICFVEVRSRSSARLGAPDETVGADKQRRLRRLAEEYLCRRRLDGPARFDVAAVVWEGGVQLRYIADAFDG